MKSSMVLMLMLVPVAASADVTGAASLGVSAGGHDHGGRLGAAFDGEVRFGMFGVGASIGFDDYAPNDDVPVHATTLTGRAGIALPVHDSSRRTVRLLIAGEVGVHHYSPSGEDHEFLGGSTRYDGDTQSRMFLGVRAGAEVAVHRSPSSSVLFKVEVVGRRDTRSTELQYSEVSCGGLFRDDDECSDREAGVIQAGGTELGVTTSIGVQFGK